ncbi:histidine kinase [Bacillus sp. FJAT-27264]|uniref:sensor histidine kinase n=1 Tax=Paenibacillus sp. (strain DSM 101736 / FJAT-27264) TaxID=1850362 RepID=UPI000807F696|nr:HAMP domain-containing sensor histidine kinase [Bacillus sp. FJAT-27264]OBZ08846.1 histidine kinase [Bacillus sp. FJAT-27264]
MRVFVKSLHITAALCLLLMISSSLLASAANSGTTYEMTKWQMEWDSRPQAPVPGLEKPSGITDGQVWTTVDGSQGSIELPPGISAAWSRMMIPELHFTSPSLYIKTLYALHVKVFVDNRLIFEGDRSFIKDNYSLLLPLGSGDSGKMLYIWTETLQDRIGIKDKVIIGEHSELFNNYVKNGLMDVILGSAFIFVALVLFVCVFYLNQAYFSSIVALAIVIFSTGVLSITYSPFIYTFYSYLGSVSIVMLDIALLSLLPSLTFLFEKIFGSGKYAVIRRFRKFQVAYSLFCLAWLVINGLSGNRFVEFYYFISTNIVGIILIVQFILLIGCVIIYSVKGNKEAIIFAIGFGTAALTGAVELIWYYVRKGDYDLVYWKWALVVFIMSLFIILGRRLMLNHQMVIKYSRELELFNNELQRSEKLQIISELAASVAHEVRNPLQVTRGFLQLLGGESHGAEKKYLNMAISELDRASNIITDFLTFAKPEFEQISMLNMNEEFHHIESIMQPLCHLSNGKMDLNVRGELWVKGNSSKFKQAFINIIKNSIEAMGEDGHIKIMVYGQGNKVHIHIRDNGEGMEPEVLNRLGEPYFSNKTKGTGLGLMVTFRIIEAMQGEIVFSSKKGAGTESITTLPLADRPDASHSL